MKYAIVIAAAFACAALAPTRGQAATGTHESSEDAARTVPGGASKGVKACHDDIEKFCKEIKPGHGRLGKCLKAHAKKLSKPCRIWLAHGGREHVDRAFAEIDASTASAQAPATAPAKP